MRKRDMRLQFGVSKNVAYCSSFETLFFNVFQNTLPLKSWDQTNDFRVFLLKRDFMRLQFGFFAIFTHWFFVH